jgi:capsular exopolysaccharide synthesis family protein
MNLLQSAVKESSSAFPPERNEAANKPENSVSEVFGSDVEVTLDPRIPLISRAKNPSVLEHYRRLRARILQEQTARPFQTLVVTSPNPQEGKTVAVLNLGLSLAMLSSLKVLVVDGDLRKGSLSRGLGVDGRVGLSNFIDGSASLGDAVLKTDELPFHIVGRGTSEIAAGELLQTYDLKSRFHSMAERFSVVLIDSPPTNLIADVQLLAAASDAVLFIARAFSTSRKSLERAFQDISKFRIIGTVLNGGTSGIPYYRYRNYY